MWHSISCPVVYLLDAPRSPPPRNIWHGWRWRVFATGEPVSVVHCDLYVAMPVGTATGGYSIWCADAAHVDLHSHPAPGPKACLVTGQGSDLHPARSDARGAAQH